MNGVLPVPVETFKLADKNPLVTRPGKIAFDRALKKADRERDKSKTRADKFKAYNEW